MRNYISLKFLVIFRIPMFILFLILVEGCKSSIPEFSGESAFHYLEKQCSFGPRNPDSRGHEQCGEYLIYTLSEFADTVLLQSFRQSIPGTSDTLEMTNIIGISFGSSAKSLLLGAHWDTRPTADHDANPERRNKPILGANDGASGVAVLLETARILTQNPHDETIYIVFFDAEDLGIEGNPRSYALGAQHFAKNLPIPKPDNAIVLDMVGDADLYLPIERNSYVQNPTLVKLLWTLADELGLDAFDKQLHYEIYDDHVPLWEEAQIPAIDIIDFNYPDTRSNFWHTHEDIPIHCSAESLYQVGTLIIHYVYER